MGERKNILSVYEICRKYAATIKNEFEKAKEDGKDEKDVKIPDNVMATLSGAFSDIIEFTKTYLITAQDQFYGLVLMSMDTQIDFTQRGPVDIKVAKDPYIVTFNPLFCLEYKFPQFVGLLVAEILRLSFAHPSTYAQLNVEKDARKHKDLEDASDASISDMIKRDIRLSSDGSAGLRLPSTMKTVSSLNNEVGRTPREGESLDYYFNFLQKYRTDPDNSNGGGSGGQNGYQGQQNEKSSSQGQSNQQSNGSESNGQQPIASPNNSQGNGTHDWEGQDAEDQEARIKSLIRNVYENLDDRQRGLMPAGLKSAIEKMLMPPEISWKQILRKMLGCLPVPYRQTRTRLNRRQPFRTDLCGRLPKRIVDVVCIFDTSGSMSDRDLKYCMNEVFNITKLYKGSRVTVIECDAAVNKVYQAKKISDLQLDMSGRGGTSFIPAIEFVNGTTSDPKWKNHPLAGKFRKSLMVYFTDGYGDYEIPKPKTYRNLWVVLHDTKNLSLKEPYGEVKSLSMDKDYQKMRGNY